MPFPTWPAGLPQEMLLEHDHGPETNVVAFRPQVGEPTLYQVGESRVRPLRGRLRVSDAELATFLEFFRTDLRSGSRQFNWTSDSFDGYTLRLQFDPDSAYSHTGMTTGWMLSVNLWIIREVA